MKSLWNPIIQSVKCKPVLLESRIYLPDSKFLAAYFAPPVWQPAKRMFSEITSPIIQLLKTTTAKYGKPPAPQQQLQCFSAASSSKPPERPGAMVVYVAIIPLTKRWPRSPASRIGKESRSAAFLSLGTGLARTNSLSSNLASFLKGSIKIMTDAEDTAKVFAASAAGKDLIRTHRYFRFSIPQGMEDLQLDEWKATERMRALTTEYLSHVGIGDTIQRCAKILLFPDENR
jgi:hypothetical protein